MKPPAVFLDTSIFAGQGYNFAATALVSFVPVANEREISLLLPDATEREVKRHFRVRADVALLAFQEARRKVPFRAMWQHFLRIRLASRHTWEVFQAAMKEWNGFLSQFDVVRLGYDGIKIERIMNLYDRCEAPFGEGKKRKEFPDAFARAGRLPAEDPGVLRCGRLR